MDNMNTLQNLTAIGVKEDEIRKGDVVELDVLDIKSAKREKWTEVTNAEDSSDVIAAYAGDLATTLRANDDLELEKNELSQQLEHLNSENGELNKAMQKGQVVDQRINEFTQLMDEMESNLNTLSNQKKIDDETLEKLKSDVEQLRNRNEELERQLDTERFDREDYNSRLRDAEESLREKDKIIEELQAIIDQKEDELLRYDNEWTQLERDVDTVMTNFYNNAREAGVQFEEL
jgi:myosin